LTVIAAARRWIVKVAVAAVLAAAVLIYAIVDDGFPAGSKAVLAVIGISAAIAPPLMLAAFWLVLGQLLELPDRLRRVPQETREHRQQIRALLDPAWWNVPRRKRFAVPRAFWRVARTALSARETLTPYAPLAPLASVPFLAGTVVAAFAAWIEVVLACVVAIVLLAS
jgi:hypothetical protein